jgi:hypothetical protein
VRDASWFARFRRLSLVESTIQQQGTMADIMDASLKVECP